MFFIKKKKFSAVIEILREIKIGVFKICSFTFDDQREMLRFLDNLQYDPSFMKLVKYEVSN
jgi:hypothetical protein